uniref:Prostaglandin-endoperoxide synthase n=1 Tax=Ictidomys tridecemlineatus TaxID=43179 RepID=A0A287DFI7_ICTTR
SYFKGVWNIVNNIPFLYVLTFRSHLIDSPPTYNVHYGYKNWEAFSNLSYYTRALPPVADDCPTPMGVKGKKELSDSKEVFENVLLRRKFLPDPQGTNMMFAFFAQHFTHQILKSDRNPGPAFTTGLGHRLYLSHVYGETLDRQHKLRLFKDRKLKYQVIDGEVYPPIVKDTQVEMIYPPHVPEHLQFAVGQKVFGLVPGLMMYATIWLQEHNRVCDVLKQEHPEWDDEWLFQTSRLILIGETIKIVIEDYVQHLNGYHFKLKFDPELLFNQQFQYQNHISSEFNTLYHWHPLLPDTFQIHDQEYNYQQFIYNNSILLKHGLTQFVEQIAGSVFGGRNVPSPVQAVAKASIDHSRNMKYQCFNDYHKCFNLKPYKLFEELTGEKEMAAELEALYCDIDALEFYPAFLVEKLLGNPMCSPHYWKPSTFGGEEGFKIINTASIQSLICRNVKGCPFDPLLTKTVTINASTSHSRLEDINSTVLLKGHSTEL